MRLIITYYTGFLQKRTDRIDIDPASTTTNLLQTIAHKIGRPVRDLKVNFKRDGYTLKVLPGWPLNHYDF
jgi:serum/glucocorticoid-regulated kinase 2